MSDLRDQLVKAITEVYLKAPAVPKVTDVADAVLPIIGKVVGETLADGRRLARQRVAFEELREIEDELGID